jgi:antitoxin component YwqK of YwqJK toxin-antitoxin module
MKNLYLSITCLTCCGLMMLSFCTEKQAEKPGLEQSKIAPEPDTTKFKDGVYLEQYPNGIKKIEGKMENGRREGIWYAWYEDGTMWSTAHYHNGLRNGYSVLYYPDGTKRIEGSYRNGKQVGTWQFWDVAGKITKEINYDRPSPVEISHK